VERGAAIALSVDAGGALGKCSGGPVGWKCGARLRSGSGCLPKRQGVAGMRGLVGHTWLDWPRHRAAFACLLRRPFGCAPRVRLGSRSNRAANARSDTDLGVYFRTFDRTGEYQSDSRYPADEEVWQSAE
jgi:hypothetical protein